jgi:hypothetical protein
LAGLQALQRWKDLWITVAALLSCAISDPVLHCSGLAKVGHAVMVALCGLDLGAAVGVLRSCSSQPTGERWSWPCHVCAALHRSSCDSVACLHAAQYVKNARDS